MLEFDRIDISGGIDINKCEEKSRRCSLCKFYYFLDKSFSYGPFLCNGCYDMSLKAVSMKNLSIINHNGNHYRVNFAFISKKDAYNLIKNATIIDKKRNIISIVDTNTFVCAFYKDEFKKIKFGDRS